MQKTLKDAKQGEFLKVTKVGSGVYRVVRVARRYATRGRYGYTEVTIQFDNRNTYTIRGRDLLLFWTWPASTRDIWNYINGGVASAPKPTPTVNGNEEFFMKYAGMVPKTPEEFKLAKKRMAMALHPDRGGSNELFLKAMELCGA